jgi:hypothetical protein
MYSKCHLLLATTSLGLHPYSGSMRITASRSLLFLAYYVIDIKIVADEPARSLRPLLFLLSTVATRKIGKYLRSIVTCTRPTSLMVCELSRAYLIVFRDRNMDGL